MAGRSLTTGPCVGRNLDLLTDAIAALDDFDVDATTTASTSPAVRRESQRSSPRFPGGSSAPSEQVDVPVERDRCGHPGRSIWALPGDPARREPA